MNKLNEWFRRADEANLFTGKERKIIKEAIATLDLVPLTQCAIEDLCDVIYKLGQFANSDVKPAPDKLSERTKNWLDAQTAEERLTTIKDICLDWDGYRTAAGLGSLINEIWAYAAYPCKNEAHVMSMDEIKSNTHETLWMESKIDNTITQLNKKGIDELFFVTTLFNWANFNQIWRIWNKKPTEEQMKETAWDD